MDKKVFLYLRVSTAMQHSGLEAQKRALEEWCKKKDITGYLIYEDENQSGTKSSRPALDKMMKDVRAGGASTVVVYSFSRFARSTTHLLSALEEFNKLGVNFCSITEQLDTNSPLGKAFFTILAALATLERDLIAERVRNGLANARAKGKKIGRTKTRPSDLIRALLKSGMSHRNIAKTLNISHGSVSLEKKVFLAEEKQAKLKAEQSAENSNPPAPQVSAASVEVLK
jgi:DNA invertase Pin-like site-specific DNA recombinase